MNSGSDRHESLSVYDLREKTDPGSTVKQKLNPDMIFEKKKTDPDSTVKQKLVPDTTLEPRSKSESYLVLT